MPRSTSNHAAQLAAVAALAPLAAAGQEQPGASESFVHVTQIRNAFYERAPRRMVPSMRRAAADACAVKRAGGGDHWLCRSESHYFLRAVNVLGTKLYVGAVCFAEDGEPDIEFFLDDMVWYDGSDCAPIWYETATSTHFIEAGAVE
jgi:hypothetical protein